MQSEVTSKVRHLFTRVLSDPDDATGVMADLDREAFDLGLTDTVLAGVDVDLVALEVLRTFGVGPTCAHRVRRLHAVAPLDATPTDALRRAARAVHDAAGRDAAGRDVVDGLAQLTTTEPVSRFGPGAARHVPRPRRPDPDLPSRTTSATEEHPCHPSH